MIAFLVGAPSWAESVGTTSSHANASVNSDGKSDKSQAVELAQTTAPKDYLAALEKEGIAEEQALADLKNALEKTEDPEEKAKLAELINKLEEKRDSEAKKPSQSTAAESGSAGSPTGVPGATGLGSLSARAAETGIRTVASQGANQIIDAMIKEAKDGPLSAERVAYYRGQIEKLPEHVSKNVEPLVRNAVATFTKEADWHQSTSGQNPFDLKLRQTAQQQTDSLAAFYRGTIAAEQTRASDFLSVAAKQSTGTLYEARELAKSTEGFSQQEGKKTDDARERFEEDLRKSRTVDTGERGPDGKPITVLPEGKVADDLRQRASKLAEEALTRTQNPDLQARTEKLFEEARDRYGEETLTRVVEAAQRGVDIAPFLPKGADNAQARLELREIARTASALQRVDDSRNSTLALGTQIVDEKQFKDFRNETYFAEREGVARSVRALAGNVDEVSRSASGLMREQGFVTQAFALLGPDAAASSLKTISLGTIPNRMLPDSAIKLGEQAEGLRVKADQLRSLAQQLERAKDAKDFGQTYDQFLVARRQLESGIQRFGRTEEGYVGNAQLTKSLAVTTASIAAGVASGGSATGLIIAAAASGGLRGGAELVDGATSKKGVDWRRVGTETVMGAVDVYGGAGATKLAGFSNQVLERSLLHASPLVKNAAYLANYALIEGGGSGALSGGVQAGLEGTSMAEGATHGFLWGTLIGGAIRGTHLAATGGVKTPTAMPDGPNIPTKPRALEAYPETAWEAAQRVAEKRGIRVTELSEAELHTIGQREIQIQALMRDRSLGYVEAREALDKGALLLSGQNSFPENKLRPQGGGRPESLHRVTSQVLSELPEDFHSLPHAERLRLARDQIQKSFEISPETPFTVAPGQTRGSLLTELSETIAGITPRPTATPRFRSVPLPEGGVSTLEAAEALLARDTRGGKGYVHTSTREGALGFDSSSGGKKAVFVYPEGIEGFVVNGRGRVFQDGRQLQGSLSPERAAGFADNDWGVLPRNLGVSRIEQAADGTAMIYLERRPAAAPTPQGRLTAAASAEQPMSSSSSTVPSVREQLDQTAQRFSDSGLAPGDWRDAPLHIPDGGVRATSLTDEFSYDVVAHGPDGKAPAESYSRDNPTIRLSRVRLNPDRLPNSQGEQHKFRAKEYLDSSGVWRSEPKKNVSKAELDSFAVDTHLPLDKTSQVLSQMPQSNGRSRLNIDWRSGTDNRQELRKKFELEYKIPFEIIVK
ncbi:MAG: hypothetical protein EBQ92_14000 [Proteobacteria bacterium]|nr:hypothetical protein [Pseudomonadota bacterium]